MEYKPSEKAVQAGGAVSEKSLTPNKIMNENYSDQNGKGNFGEDDEKQEKKKIFGVIDPENDKIGQKLKDVSLAGFSFFARARSVQGRIFWALLITAVIIVCVYECVKTVIDFVGSPVITTYSLKIQDQLEFPKIFICPAVFINASFFNANPSRSKAAIEVLNTYELLGSMNATLKNLTKQSDALFRKFDNTPPMVDRDTTSSSSSMTGNEAYEHLMNLGFDETKLFLECKFYDNDNFTTIPCPKAVTPIIDQRYGKCYQFDVGNYSQKTDARGLSLLIDSYAKRYVTDKNLMENYVGLFVGVNSEYQPASYEQMLVPPGAYTKMALSKEHFVMLNLQSGSLIQPCKETSDTNLTILNVTYSQSGCQMECVLQEVIRECKCIPLMNKETVFSSVLASAPFCGLNDTQFCVNPKVNEPESADAIDKCQKTCLPPCDSYRYKMRSTSAPLNAGAFSGKNEVPEGSSIQELVWLDIAFSRIEYVEFAQDSSMTFDSFVGNAGGQITLWIGGCMMTLLPLPFALISFLVMSCITRCEKKKIAAEM